jgi:hypothetical protein
VQNRIADTWFELPGEPPKAATSQAASAIADALHETAALHNGNHFAIRRQWPAGDQPKAALKKILRVIKSGNAEFCMLEMPALKNYLSDAWPDALHDLALYAFTNEQGNREFDRSHPTLLAWYQAALRSKNIHHRLSYESLQITRRIEVINIQNPQPPVARGGCSCLGPVPVPTIKLAWTTSSWSPVISGFFARPS